MGRERAREMRGKGGEGEREEGVERLDLDRWGRLGLGGVLGVWIGC